MIIVRDIDTSQKRAAQILSQLSMPAKHTAVLDDKHDPLYGTKDDCVVFITTMPNGCLGYQKKFFDAYRHKIPLWGVLLLNDDEVIHNHLNESFRSSGLRRRIFRITPETDYNVLADSLTSLAAVHPRLAAVYSARLDCGRKTLIRLLSEYLPDWEFQPAGNTSSHNSLLAAKAGQVIIIGQTLQDIFAVQLSGNIEPFYVLTMPDMNVQAYLKQASLSELMLEHGGTPEAWTLSMIKQHLFYVSPLYESWYRTKTNPKFDSRFVMWDRFGLPCPKNEYTDKNIFSFLSQFQQCGALAQALKDTL